MNDPETKAPNRFDRRFGALKSAAVRRCKIGRRQNHVNAGRRGEWPPRPRFGGRGAAAGGGPMTRREDRRRVKETAKYNETKLSSILQNIQIT
jgi:hypothetical protein